MRELEAIKKSYEDARKAAAQKVTALMDRTLARIQREIPGATFLDAMGVTQLYDKNAGGKDNDPLYMAFERIRDEEGPTSEEEFGDALPPEVIKANRLISKYSEPIMQLIELGLYLEDDLGYTYA